MGLFLDNFAGGIRAPDPPGTRRQDSVASESAGCTHSRPEPSSANPNLAICSADTRVRHRRGTDARSPPRFPTPKLARIGARVGPPLAVAQTNARIPRRPNLPSPRPVFRPRRSAQHTSTTPPSGRRVQGSGFTVAGLRTDFRQTQRRGGKPPRLGRHDRFDCHCGPVGAGGAREQRRADCLRRSTAWRTGYAGRLGGRNA